MFFSWIPSLNNPDKKLAAFSLAAVLCGLLFRTKGSRKNNFTFWHLIFKSFLADFEEQKP